MKSKIAIIALLALIIVSCKKEQMQTKNDKSDPNQQSEYESTIRDVKKHEAEVVESTLFSFDDFVIDPFIDNIYVPPIIADNYDIINNNGVISFDVTAETVKTNNGNYEYKKFTDIGYVAVYWEVGTIRTDEDVQRHNLIITTNKYRMKYGIVIGDDISTIKNIIRGYYYEEYSRPNKNAIIVSSEEFYVCFFIKDEKLERVEIQIGT